MAAALPGTRLPSHLDHAAAESRASTRSAEFSTSAALEDLGCALQSLPMLTRDEHLQWSKRRAMDYVNRGDLFHALTSIEFDLRKHPETANHSSIDFGLRLYINGGLRTIEELRRFIEDLH